jgi:uncharacterized protein RhaS with RHS repeats
LEKDPIGFAGGDANLYGYVLNDPVNLIDINGKEPSLVNLIMYNPGWCATGGAVYYYNSVRTQLNQKIDYLKADIESLGKNACDSKSALKIKALQQKINEIQSALDKANFWEFQNSMLKACMDGAK